MKTPYWFLYKTPLAILLLPFAFIYNLFSRIIYRIRSFRAYTPRRTVICIGNILAGGVGKTPIVRAVAHYLDAPVVMRGYRRGRGTSNIGDEAMMLSSDGLIVHTGDRKSNVMLLDRQNDDTPIVMDDGFQNPCVKKTISVLVFDESIGVGNGFILPSGPMREGLRAVRRADAVLIIKSNGRVRKIKKLPPEIPVFYAKNKTTSPYRSDEKLFAFAGIGYPKKFFASLQNVIGCRAFPDHYQYTDQDIEWLIKRASRKGAKLVTTEKDWMRLPEYARAQIKFAGLETKIDNAFFIWLKGRLNGKNNKKS